MNEAFVTNYHGSPEMSLVSLLFTIFYLYCTWRIYVKAGQPGWASLIPIYNFIVLLKIAGKPLWWFILLLVPLVNIIIIVILTHQISVRFGHGVGFTLGLLFLPIIFIPILALGSSKYSPERKAA